jgi:hypothetical protein
MSTAVTFRSFKGVNGEPNGFGLAALERAREAGFSDKEIVAGVEAEGLHFGEKAKEALGGLIAE